MGADEVEDGATRHLFATMLSRARAEAGLTQEDLAERSGMSVRAISDLERARAGRPRRRSAQTLGAALGLTGRALTEFFRVAGIDGIDAEPPAAAPTGGGSAVSGFAGAGSAALCALPPPSPVLVGRDATLAELERIVKANADGDHPSLVTISGQPGVGKSAAVVAAGYRLTGQFPDGHLFVALQGEDRTPLEPTAVLGRLLVGLGVAPLSLPNSLEERASLYRSLLRERRILVVLDNAVDEAQIRPLLPAGPTVMLVTSRRRLAGLPATYRVFLDVLSPLESADLVALVIGRDRCLAEPTAVANLVADCGGLPLALRIVANRLASRPEWSVQRLGDRLADHRRRLDELRAGDLTVRGPFELSYEQLEPLAAALFRRLALIGGPDFDTELAAVLIGADGGTAEDILDDLLDASLVEAAGADRYRLHDMVRLFARYKLDEAEPAAQLATVEGRLIEYLLGTVVHGGCFYELDPDVAERLRTAPVGHPLGTRSQAARWLAAESANWLAALRRAVETGRYELATQVGLAMHWFSDVNTALMDLWAEVFALTTEAARAAGRPGDEAVQRNFLGWAVKPLAGHRIAATHHEQALDLAARAGDRREQGWSLLYLSTLSLPDRPASRSIRLARVGTSFMDPQRYPLDAALAQFYLGLVLQRAGRRRPAARAYQRSLDGYAHRAGDDPDSPMSFLLAIAALAHARNHLALGRPGAAIRLACYAASRFAALDMVAGQANCHSVAADCLRRLGNLSGALRHLDAALRLFAISGARGDEAMIAVLRAELFERRGIRTEADRLRERARWLAANSPDLRDQRE